MLSIDIKVNGTIVAVVHAHRGAKTKIGKNTFLYAWRSISFPLDMMQTGKAFIGEVEHDYDDGIEHLASAILKNICAKQKL